MSGKLPPAGPDDRAVYVHFPYCASRCPYCDFNSHVVDHADHRYADAVLAELEARATDPAEPAVSLFFGGGTPSRWAPSAVARVVHAIAQRGRTDDWEVTLEANPGSVERARFGAYAEAGINRLSVGCQSFDDDELRWLGRVHDAKAAEAAVATAVKTGLRVSLDVMYGLPGQSWEAIRTTLDRAIDLGTEHLSAYALTVEPGTILAKRASLKRFVPTSDDRMADLYERVTEHLDQAGFHRYEVSNYARPGAESRHNCLYWHSGRYLGLGAGAHSFGAFGSGFERRENAKLPRLYLEGCEAGDFAPRFRETLTPLERVKDHVMTASRTRWGIAPAELQISTEHRRMLVSHLEQTAESLMARGLVRCEGQRWVPTDLGFRFADTVALAWTEAVDRVEASRASRGG